MSSLNWIKTFIRERMEDPAARDAKWEAHLRGVEAAAAAAKANMSHPTKAWGFWRGEKHTGKFDTNSDPAVGKLPGRRSGASRVLSD